MLNHRLTWPGIAAGCILGAIGIAAMVSPRGRADELPGTVAQSASATDGAVTVTVDKAVFSAGSTDVWVHVSSTNPRERFVGVEAADAALGGNAATSATGGRTGQGILRFPDPTISGPTTDLSIRAVKRIGDNGPERVLGQWRLVIALPMGEDARKAARVEALKPGLAEMNGTEVPIEAFRTSSATIVRYQLPAEIRSIRPPTLRVGSRSIEPLRDESRGQGTHELWFESTPSGSALTMTFGEVYITNRQEFSVALSLNAFNVPLPKGNQTEEYVLDWQRTSGPGGLAPKSLTWRRDVSGTTLLVRLEGLWDPGPQARPRVEADGVGLTVRGLVMYAASQDRGAESMIEVDLPSGKVPRLLSVALAGESKSSPPISVTLEP